MNGERTSKWRYRVWWLMDRGERWFAAVLAAAGVAILDGPAWAVFGVMWLTSLSVDIEKRVERDSRRG
jgi:hypothetical protein